MSKIVVKETQEEVKIGDTLVCKEEVEDELFGYSEVTKSVVLTPEIANRLIKFGVLEAIEDEDTKEPINEKNIVNKYLNSLTLDLVKKLPANSTLAEMVNTIVSELDSKFPGMVFNMLIRDYAKMKELTYDGPMLGDTIFTILPHNGKIAVIARDKITDESYIPTFRTKSDAEEAIEVLKYAYNLIYEEPK